MNMLRVVVLTLTTSGLVFGGDWPQFRGPASAGVSPATGLPVKWNGTDVAWKAALPGAGASSPISLGDRLYVTCYSGYGIERGGSMENLTLHFVGLNRADGKILFDTKIKPTLPESERVRDHGYAAATPATDGKNIFTFFGKSGVIAFDPQGRQLWRKSVGDKTHRWGCGTSPVLYKNLVIVNASVESRSLVALDKATGAEVWRATGMNQSWNTPHLVRLASGAAELVVSVKNRVVGFDPASGKELWSCAGVEDYVCPSVVSADGIVYAIGGRQSVSMAIRAGGRGDVTQTHRLWKSSVGANVTSPAIHDGRLYWVSDRNRVAYCVDCKTGDVVFQKRFPAQPYASTLIADKKLYVVTRRNGVYVLAAQPQYAELGHNSFDDSSLFNASPIVSDGRLLIRSDRYLYCVQGKSSAP